MNFRLASDGHQKPKRTESLRKSGQKPTGGQPGHEGQTLKMVQVPERTVTHAVECGAQCQAGLGGRPATGYEERPVFAIPALRIEVTAHRAESKRCPTCGTRTQGTLPVGVPQAGQYGREVKTWAAYLSNPHHLPVERTAQIFADLGHQPICDATVLKASADLSEAGGNTRRRSIG